MTIRLRVICFLLLLLSGLGAAEEGVAGNGAAAEAVVEGLLYFASDDSGSPLPGKAVEIDAGLQQALSVRLAKVFGFRHYHLMGRHTQ
ncbi:MAG: hypothetical protein ACK5CW_10050 [Verrucomicrobiota bacterium]